MRLIIVFLCFIGTQCLSAQDSDASAFAAEAEKITYTYAQQLGLSSEQAVAFHKTTMQFLEKKNKLSTVNVSQEDKVFMLKQLSEQETAEMETVLSKAQLKKYRMLKSKNPLN